MKAVKISADLERKLRASTDPLCAKVVELLDAPKKVKVEKEGLTYRDAIWHARDILGDRVLFPPSPNPGWVARTMARFTDKGIDAEQFRRLLERASAVHHTGSIDFERLSWKPLEYLYGPSSDHPISTDAGNRAAESGGGVVSRRNTTTSEPARITPSVRTRDLPY